MGLLETRYAKTADGLHIAYYTLGDGPTDLVQVGSYFSNLEHIWSHPTLSSAFRALAELGRLIGFDGRGTGLSDRLRGDQLPSLEKPDR
jgi:pimeloyl-ACP methyl ester carboxylesterase